MALKPFILCCSSVLEMWTLCGDVTIFLPLLCQKMKDDSDDDKKQQINYIQNLYGFNLFCQKRFDDSMQVFAKLGTGTASPERLLWSSTPVLTLRILLTKLVPGYFGGYLYFFLPHFAKSIHNCLENF